MDWFNCCMGLMGAVEVEREWRPGVARTPTEIEALVATLRAAPMTWHVYSRHSTMGAAYQRSHQVRVTNPVKTLEPYMMNLRWWVVNVKDDGPTLLVRWVPAGSVAALPPQNYLAELYGE